MPRKFLFTKDEIINAAVEITREKGFSSVTARALGDKLGSSSRPVFSYFDSMAQVQAAVVSAADKIHRDYIRAELEAGKYPPFKCCGMAYVRFARNEKELFKVLFMRDRTNESGPLQADTDEFVDIITKQVGISKRDAAEFYTEMWVYVHGMATMIATGYLDWDDDFVSRSLSDAYAGLKQKFEKHC